MKRIEIAQKVKNDPLDKEYGSSETPDLQKVLNLTGNLMLNVQAIRTELNELHRDIVTMRQQLSGILSACKKNIPHFIEDYEDGAYASRLWDILMTIEALERRDDSSDILNLLKKSQISMKKEDDERIRHGRESVYNKVMDQFNAEKKARDEELKKIMANAN